MKFDRVEKFNKQTLVYGIQDLNMIEDTSVNIFNHNKIKCFVEFYLHYHNNECLIEYDVSGLKSIMETYKRSIVSRKLLCDIVSSAFEVLDTAYEYLLNPEKIVWDIEYIFYDEFYNKIRSIYIPTGEVHTEHNSIMGFIYQIFKYIKIDARDVELEHVVSSVIRGIERNDDISPETVRKQLSTLVSNEVENTKPNEFSNANAGRESVSSVVVPQVQNSGDVLPGYMQETEDNEVPENETDNYMVNKNAASENYLGVNIPLADIDEPVASPKEEKQKQKKEKKEGKKLFGKKEKDESKEKKKKEKKEKKPLFSLGKKKVDNNSADIKESISVNGTDSIDAPLSPEPEVRRVSVPSRNSVGNVIGGYSNPGYSNETVIFTDDVDDRIIEAAQQKKEPIQIDSNPYPNQINTNSDKSLQNMNIMRQIEYAEPSGNGSSAKDDGDHTVLHTDPDIYKTVFDESGTDSAYLVDLATSNKTLITSRYTIGRSTDCNLVLTNRKVSHHHALLEYKNSSFYITDTGSLNHIFLNGVKQPVNEPVKLNNGDEIRISEYKYKFILE